MDICIAAFQELRQGVHTHSTRSVERFKENKPFGGDIAQEGFEIVEVCPLNWLRREDTLVKLLKNCGGFLVGFVPALYSNVQISYGVLSSFKIVSMSARKSVKDASNVRKMYGNSVPLMCL